MHALLCCFSLSIKTLINPKIMRIWSYSDLLIYFKLVKPKSACKLHHCFMFHNLVCHRKALRICLIIENQDILDEYSKKFIVSNCRSYVTHLLAGFFLFCRCGYDQYFPASSYHPVDGVLGLGRGRTSLVSQLSSQGLLQNVVGHCLSTHGGGYMFFGDGYDSSRVTWTPMSSGDL